WIQGIWPGFNSAVKVIDVINSGYASVISGFPRVNLGWSYGKTESYMTDGYRLFTSYALPGPTIRPRVRSSAYVNPPRYASRISASIGSGNCGNRRLDCFLLIPFLNGFKESLPTVRFT